jgi:hypothetical protein
MTKRPAIRPVPQGFASVAGAGTGTGLLALMSLLPPSSHVKPLITFAAPTVSVAISAIWLYARNALDMYLADTQVTSQIKKAQGILERIEVDPRSSEQLKKEARTKFEALIMAELNIHEKRVQRFGAVG